MTTIIEVALIAILICLIRAQPTDEPDSTEPVELDDADFVDSSALEESTEADTSSAANPSAQDDD